MAQSIVAAAAAAAQDEECAGDFWEGNRFTWPDYVVFVGTLLVSVGIGVFHGFIVGRGQQKTTADILVGNRQMNFFTLGISLTVGFASAISILGNVSEMYNYGTQYAVSLVGIVVMVPTTALLCLPVIRELGITSMYEYLERRFNNTLRLFVTCVYMIQLLMYLAVVVYAPALALRQVTGISTMYAVALIFCVGILYTSMGGIKAVVWSDVFQYLILMSGLTALLIRGAMMDGGPSHIWQTAKQMERIEFFLMDPDPRIRHSFWSCAIGGSFYWACMNTGQATMQRLLTVPTLRDAVKALCLAGVGMIVMFSMTFYMGLQAVTHFQECDPLLSKSIDASDQLLPLYMMEVAGSLPGLPGLFVAGIFSASLSTLASGLNAMSAIVLRDLLGGAFGYKPSDKYSPLITRLLAVLCGLLSFGLTFLVAQLGGVMQIAISFNGMVIGVIAALFILGMYVPWSNTKGVLTGAGISLAVVLWLGFGAQVATLQGLIVHPRKEVGVDCDCEIQFPQPVDPSEVFDGYRVSYFWYSPLGWVLTMLLGTLASGIFGWKSHLSTLDPALLASVVRKPFTKKIEKKYPKVEPVPPSVFRDIMVL